MTAERLVATLGGGGNRHRIKLVSPQDKFTFYPALLRLALVYTVRNSTDARRLLPRRLWTVAARELDQIDAAVALDNLRVPPGNRLEALKADRLGQHSIRINVGSDKSGMIQEQRRLKLLIIINIRY